MLSMPCFNKVFAGELLVATASNFAIVLKQLIADFEARTTEDVSLVMSSSGKIYAQIVQGAPYDIFLSADTDKPERLERAGLVVPKSRFTYARGSLVLWSGNPTLLSNSPQSLIDAEFNKIALANAKLAPYGQAAEEVLSALGLSDSTQHKWVRGDNVAQVYQFIESGNAELGFVAKSQILQEGRLKKGSVWYIPSSFYSAIEQDAVILKQSKNPALAAQFMAFLASDHAKQIIMNYGYAHFDGAALNSMQGEN